MFDSLKNLGQMTQLMAKAQKFQEAVKTMQDDLASKRITGDAGDQRVIATVNGRMELLDLRIDPTRIDPANLQLIQELSVAAVRSAQYRAAEYVRQEMQRLGNELGIDPSMLPNQLQ